ncbi:MAG TPA: glycosyltransferase family 39 protein, partial [Polyangiales bacterium]
MLWSALACGFVAALLLSRISGFGIWDPWELGTADLARHLAAGDPVTTPASWSTWLVSQGFRHFGVHEWAGRTPIALAGIVTALLAYMIGSRFAGPRVGLYTALITGTSPLFVFNARAMLGDAPAFATHTAVGLCALGAAFPARSPSADKPTRTLGWLLALGAALALAVGTRGALLGALPPLLAATLVSWIMRPTGDSTEPARDLSRYVLSALSVALVALVVRDAVGDSAQRSLWLGGQATSGTPPTFDSVIEAVFQSFAPWSALLPLAMGRMWQLTAAVHEEAGPAAEAPTQDRAAPLRLAALLWAALGYGAQTLFLSRYGREVTFLPLAALAVLVALFLDDVERHDRRSWAAAVAALFLAGLILRDYALYPNSPLRGVPIANFEVPKVWNPKGAWALAFGAFGALALLGLGTPTAQGSPRWLAPYRFVPEQWRR